MRLLSIVKSILSEVVPFEKAADVEKGMIQKHGFSNLREGTFGIEIEFEPTDEDLDANEVAKDMDWQDVVSVITSSEGSRVFDMEYESWVTDRRKAYNRRTYKSSNWDDSYGPIDIDNWLDMNPEPDSSDDEAWGEWNDNKKDVEREYQKWEWNHKDDYMEEFAIENIIPNVDSYIGSRTFINALLNSTAYRQKYGDLLKKGEGKEYYIQQLEQLLESLGESVGPTPNERNWNVGDDGDLIEIRSRHLRASDKDFATVAEIFQFMKDNDYKVHEETSAHIHVGLPYKFDIFALLAITTLVDESKVKDAVGKRSLERWAKLRGAFEWKVAKEVERYLKKDSVFSKAKPDEKGKDYFDFSEAALEDLMMNASEKYTGTNIRSYWDHGTVEFRYFGSNVRGIQNFFTWIKYFMMLPSVAMSRKEVKIGNVYFKKHNDGRITASLSRNIRLSALPKVRDVKI